MFNGDPREAEYPWQSTYAYYSNSPIWKIDYKGGGGPPVGSSIYLGQNEGKHVFDVNGDYEINSEEQKLSGVGSAFVIVAPLIVPLEIYVTKGRVTRFMIQRFKHGSINAAFQITQHTIFSEGNPLKKWDIWDSATAGLPYSSFLGAAVDWNVDGGFSSIIGDYTGGDGHQGKNMIPFLIDYGWNYLSSYAGKRLNARFNTNIHTLTIKQGIATDRFFWALRSRWLVDSQPNLSRLRYNIASYELKVMKESKGLVNGVAKLAEYGTMTSNTIMNNTVSKDIEETLKEWGKAALNGRLGELWWEDLSKPEAQSK